MDIMLTVLVGVILGAVLLAPLFILGLYTYIEHRDGAL